MRIFNNATANILILFKYSNIRNVTRMSLKYLNCNKFQNSYFKNINNKSVNNKNKYDGTQCILIS